MGVINISPESFFSGSYVSEDKIRQKAEEMITQGADIIDIGARSTAPGSNPISIQEEKKRIAHALRSLDGSGITISIDTMHPEVLEEAMKHEIHAVNDISGLINEVMAHNISDSGLPAVLMATTKTPGDSITFSETISALSQVTQRAMNAEIPSYILDPAIGRWILERGSEQDFELCRRFTELHVFDRPLLAAVSRKSFIGSATGREPQDRLAGTLGVTACLIQAGAAMIRCHDVPETRDLVTVISCIQGA
ncbi:MAG: dihydropteroate synthase [Methanobacteriota archaeon]